MAAYPVLAVEFNMTDPGELVIALWAAEPGARDDVEELEGLTINYRGLYFIYLLVIHVFTLIIFYI